MQRKKQRFRRLANALLSRTYLLRNVYDDQKKMMDLNSDYRTARRFFTILQGYFGNVGEKQGLGYLQRGGNCQKGEVGAVYNASLLREACVDFVQFPEGSLDLLGGKDVFQNDLPGNGVLCLGNQTFPTPGLGLMLQRAFPCGFGSLRCRGRLGRTPQGRQQRFAGGDIGVGLGAGPGQSRVILQLTGEVQVVFQNFVSFQLLFAVSESTHYATEWKKLLHTQVMFQIVDGRLQGNVQRIEIVHALFVRLGFIPQCLDDSDCALTAFL